MINLIEVKNFRSLKYISQKLNGFNVLVGANATGKTTFMDLIKFVADIVDNGIEKAVFERVSNFDELTFGKQGGDIEFAIELKLPESKVRELRNSEKKKQIILDFSEVDGTKKNEVESGRKYEIIRYEIKIGKILETDEIAIKDEVAWLLPSSASSQTDTFFSRTLFPQYFSSINSVFNSNGNKFLDKEYKRILSKKFGGNDNFYVETADNSGWIPSFKLGIKKSALGNLPDDETRFPASTWLKKFLLEEIQLFILNSLIIKRPSPPGQGLNFKTDGSNLPWVIDNLRHKNPDSFRIWLEHIQTTLKDIVDIDTRVREDDRHRYIVVKYKNEVEVPSWLVSDGTLRLLALTIPAYISNLTGAYLIEEPENGIHPKAIECVFQSLSSVYSAQILLASHSPIILGIVEPKNLLCFGKTPDGITDVVLGSEHPKLRDWKGTPNLSSLFAGGILS